MSWIRGSKAGRALAVLLALGEPTAGAAALVAGAVVLMVPSEAAAQTAWGVSRRTARRTTRRNVYYGGAATPYLGALPAGYRTVAVSGATYYETGGVRYQAKIVEGNTVYVQVQ